MKKYETLIVRKMILSWDCRVPNYYLKNQDTKKQRVLPLALEEIYAIYEYSNDRIISELNGVNALSIQDKDGLCKDDIYWMHGWDYFSKVGQSLHQRFMISPFKVLGKLGFHLISIEKIGSGDGCKVAISDDNCFREEYFLYFERELEEA